MDVPQNPRLAYPGVGHAILMLLVLLGLQLLLGGAVAVVGMAVQGSNAGASIVGHPVAMAVVNTVAFGLVLLWGFGANAVPWRVLLPLTRVPTVSFAAMAVSVVGLGMILSEIDNVLRSVLPMPGKIVEVLNQALASESSPWASLFLVVVVAAVTEELVFRGVMLRGLLARVRPATAIGVSALLFALMHANPWQFAAPLALGMLFGWWYYRTRSLWPCLFGHALNNAKSSGLRYAPFDIPGYTGSQDVAGTALHQPWWLTLGGVALLAIGVVWFHRCVPRRAEPPPMPMASETPASESNPTVPPPLPSA